MAIRTASAPSRPSRRQSLHRTVKHLRFKVEVSALSRGGSGSPFPSLRRGLRGADPDGRPSQENASLAPPAPTGGALLLRPPATCAFDVSGLSFPDDLRIP